MFHRFFAHTSSETARNVKASSLLTALVLTMAVLFGFTASNAYATNAKQVNGIGKPVVHNPNSAAALAPKSQTPVKSHAGFGMKAHPNFGTGTTYFTNFQQTLPFSIPEGDEADAVAIDRSGNIFVGDWTSGNVYEEVPNSTGGYNQTLLFTLDAGGPTGIAVDDFDDLYISNDQTSEIIFASESGGVWTPRTLYSGNPLACSFGLALDGYYNIYIADFCAGAIFEMAYNDHNGTWAAPVALFDSPYPLGVAVDYYGENIYVADQSDGYIYEASYDFGDSSWDIFDTLGTNLGSDTGWGGVALAQNGTVYAANYNDGSVIQLVPSEYGFIGNLVSTQLGGGAGQVAVDASNNIYVGGSFSTSQWYSFKNNFGLDQNGYYAPTSVQANFWLANGVTTGQSQIQTSGTAQETQFQFLSDSCSNITSTGQYCSIVLQFAPFTVGNISGGVSLYDSTGNFLATSQSFYGTSQGSVSAILPGTYNFIGGIYAYAANAPNVAPMRQHDHLKALKAHSANAVPNFSFSSYPGVYPAGIAVDADLDIFVADAGDMNVNIPCNIYASYDEGYSWTTLPMYQFLCPTGGLAIDGSGNLFYTVWFDNGGTSEAGIGVSYLETPATYVDGTGEIPAIYSMPLEVAVDTNYNAGYLLHTDAVAVDEYDNVYFTGSDYSIQDDYVYVVPANNYESTPNYAIQVLPAPYNNNLGYQAYQQALGITVDQYSDVFVTDYADGSVWVEYPTTYGYQYEVLSTSYDTPTSIALDNIGNLYVVDSGDSSGVSSLNLLSPFNSECWGGNSECFTSVPLISSPYTYGYSYIWNLAVDPFNDFWFTDFGTWGGLITYVDTWDPMTINFNETALGVTSTDSPEFVYLFSAGNEPLTFYAPATGFNPSVSANFVLDATQGLDYYFPGTTTPVLACQQLNSGSTTNVTLSPDYACALPLSFDPLTAGGSEGYVLATTDSYASNDDYAAPAAKTSAHKALKAKKPQGGVVTYTQVVADLSGYGDEVVPTVVLASDWNPALVQNAVAFAVNVTGPGTTPTGTVNLYDGTTLVGSGSLFQGATTINVTFTTTGTHVMEAVYEGDGNYEIADSALLNQVVTDFSASFDVEVGTNSPTFCQATPFVSAGGSLTLGFSISPVAPATTIPGPITFSADGAPVGTTYVFSPASIATGAGSTPVTLTMTIPQMFVADLHKPQGNNNKLPVAPLALAVLLLPLAGRMRKAGKRLTRLLSIALFAIAGISATAALSGCGVNTTATYEVVITSQSGTLFHTMSCDIVVK